ncbi:MAG: hypothetical protein IPO40_04710 [Fibrobacteres bacterium]|nr:hypothetical protein [Fibrobacterota bacterium]
MKIKVSLGIGVALVFVATSCDKSSESESVDLNATNTIEQNIVGDWYRFRRTDSSFDSANYYFESKKIIRATNFLAINKGLRIQLQKMYGSWSVQADSILFNIDSALTSYDSGKTFDKQIDLPFTYSMKASIEGDSLFLTNLEATLRFKRAKIK